MSTLGLGTAPAPAPQDTAALKAALAARLVRGTNWFYWIAGLSMVNAVLASSSSGMRFIVGLGITQIVDYIALKTGSVGIVAGLVIDAFIAGLFVLFGVLSRKRKKWALILGMLLYAGDALIFLLGPDLLALGFHAFALFGLYGGLKAMNELSAMEQAASSISTGPAPIG